MKPPAHTPRNFLSITPRFSGVWRRAREARNRFNGFIAAFAFLALLSAVVFGASRALAPDAPNSTDNKVETAVVKTPSGTATNSPAAEAEGDGAAAKPAAAAGDSGDGA